MNIKRENSGPTALRFIQLCLLECLPNSLHCTDPESQARNCWLLYTKDLDDETLTDRAIFTVWFFSYNFLCNFIFSFFFFLFLFLFLSSFFFLLSSFFSLLSSLFSSFLSLSLSLSLSLLGLRLLTLSLGFFSDPMTFVLSAMLLTLSQWSRALTFPTPHSPKSCLKTFISLFPTQEPRSLRWIYENACNLVVPTYWQI